jgi:hypothetical protein
MPFYIKDFSILGFWYSQGVLEFQDTAVLAVMGMPCTGVDRYSLRFAV